MAKTGITSRVAGCCSAPLLPQSRAPIMPSRPRLTVRANQTNQQQQQTLSTPLSKASSQGFQFQWSKITQALKKTVVPQVPMRHRICYISSMFIPVALCLQTSLPPKPLSYSAVCFRFPFYISSCFCPPSPFILQMPLVANFPVEPRSLVGSGLRPRD